MQSDRMARVSELLADPDNRVIAFEPTGAAVVALPAGLPCRADIVDAVTPLDPLGPASQGKAVALFDLARRHGMADGAVKLADDGSPAVLHIIDLSDSHGVFIAALTPLAEAADVTTSAAALLTPRHFTALLSPTGVFLDVDADFVRALGWSADEMIGTSSIDILHPDDHERGIVNWAELLDQPGNTRRMRQRMRRQDGSWVWLEVTDHNRLDDPAEPCVFSEMVDISDEMQAISELHKREALLARVTEAMPTGVLHVEPDGAVVFANARWWEITGLDPGSDLVDLVGACVDDGNVEAALETASGGIVDVDLDVAFHHEPTGERRYGRLSLRPLDPSTPGALLLAIEDTTAATTVRLQLAEDARRDPLTKLLNRSGIRSRLDDALAAGGSVAVLYLDLDQFKQINDRHSHARGDDVLCAVAEKLTSVLRPGDSVGRVGGDEFLMVLGDVTRPDDAYSIASRLEREIGDVSGRWGQGIHVAASIGVAIAADDEARDELIARADALMYERKATKASVTRH